MEAERRCTECEDGVYVSPAVKLDGGRVIPERRSACHACEGRGILPAPDFNAIFEAVTTARGVKAGGRKFRKSAPEAWKQSNKGLSNRRAYYVWRWARFHGGADVTMPMTAELFCGRDAWKKELDAYAEALARRVFGTDLAGAHRWSQLLVGGGRVEGLPSSAYEGGPVQDGNKPDFEKPELK